jgi:hypothetical protein
MTTWTLLLLTGATFCGPEKRRDPTAGLPARPGEEWVEIVRFKEAANEYIACLDPMPRTTGFELVGTYSLRGSRSDGRTTIRHIHRPIATPDSAEVLRVDEVHTRSLTIETEGRPSAKEKYLDPTNVRGYTQEEFARAHLPIRSG